MTIKPFIHLDNINKIYDSLKEQPNVRVDFPKSKELSETKVFEQKQALSDISLDIHEGQRVGIIGENGAGKSTLLSIISGIIAPTSGKLEIQGKVNAILSLGIGFREDLTGRENIYLASEIQGKDRKQIDLEIDEMIEFSELGEFIDRPMRIYSSGMKAKLAFTAAVFVHPEILIIDETLSVGDIYFSGKATKMIKNLCNSGRIVIVVSHSLGSIVEICNRCIWLKEGRMSADGNPKEITEAYQKSIRNRNEEKVKAEFSSIPSLKKQTDNLILKNISIYGNNENKNDHRIIKENEDFKVSLLVAAEKHLTLPKLYFKIERLDGLCIVNEAVTDLTVLKNGNKEEVQFVVSCGAIKLRPGYYKCLFILSNNEHRLEEMQIIFQVISDSIVKGGNPALRWPTEYSTQCLSIPKANEVI